MCKQVLGVKNDEWLKSTICLDCVDYIQLVIWIWRLKPENVDLQILLNSVFIFVDKDVKLTWMRRVESILHFS